jgi:hypothetical protein
VYPDNSNKSEDDTNTPRGIFGENISQFLTPEWLPIFFWIYLVFSPLFNTQRLICI